MSKNKKKTGFEDSIKPESDYDHLQCHLRPQWGLRTFLLILIFVVVYTAIYIDLEINLKELFRNSSKYIFDVVRRMIPPDFSDFGNLAHSMLETVEIAMLGTLLAILLSLLHIFECINLITFQIHFLI